MKWPGSAKRSTKFLIWEWEKKSSQRIRQAWDKTQILFQIWESLSKMPNCPRCEKPVYFGNFCFYWRCNQYLYSAERVTSLGKDWHRPCLKCEKCNKVSVLKPHSNLNFWRLFQRVRTLSTIWSLTVIDHATQLYSAQRALVAVVPSLMFSTTSTEVNKFIWNTFFIIILKRWVPWTCHIVAR